MFKKRSAIATAIVAMAMSLTLAGCGVSGNPVPSDNTAAIAGQAKFASACARCHSASSLRSTANLITNNMGTLSGSMSGITLTDQEVADLQAYIATQ